MTAYPPALVERVAAALRRVLLGDDRPIPAQHAAWWANLARAALDASGHAEMVAALEAQLKWLEDAWEGCIEAARQASVEGDSVGDREAMQRANAFMAQAKKVRDAIAKGRASEPTR